MKTTKVTIHTLRAMKERGEKIAVLTAYDATFARLLDEAGADVLLVGDSLGMDDSFKPKFVRRYEQLSMRIRNAVQHFVEDVRGGTFPAAQESFALEPEKKGVATDAPVYSTVANKG